MLSKSKIQTQKFAISLARRLVQANRPEQSRRATIIALHGDLGAGKTTFVQGFMKALGVKHHVTSPTFLIVRKYNTPTTYDLRPTTYRNVYHLDLYRIQKPKELLDLGFKKILQDPHAIALIEWPERIKKLLPKNTIWINFEHGKNEKERIIEVVSG